MKFLRCVASCVGSCTRRANSLELTARRTIVLIVELYLDLRMTKRFKEKSSYLETVLVAELSARIFWAGSRQAFV